MAKVDCIPRLRDSLLLVFFLFSFLQKKTPKKRRLLTRDLSYHLLWGYLYMCKTRADSVQRAKPCSMCTQPKKKKNTTCCKADLWHEDRVLNGMDTTIWSRLQKRGCPLWMGTPHWFHVFLVCVCVCVFGGISTHPKMSTQKSQTLPQQEEEEEQQLVVAFHDLTQQVEKKVFFVHAKKKVLWCSLRNFVALSSRPFCPLPASSQHIQTRHAYIVNESDSERDSSPSSSLWLVWSDYGRKGRKGKQNFLYDLIFRRYKRASKKKKKKKNMWSNVRVGNDMWRVIDSEKVCYLTSSTMLLSFFSPRHRLDTNCSFFFLSAPDASTKTSCFPQSNSRTLI